MKRLIISLVAVLGLLVLTDTASASHRFYGGPQRGFGISVGPGYYGGGYYSGYRGGYYSSPYYGNGYYGGGYYSSPSYYYSSPGGYYAPQGSYYYGPPSFGIMIGR